MVQLVAARTIRPVFILSECAVATGRFIENRQSSAGPSLPVDRLGFVIQLSGGEPEDKKRKIRPTPSQDARRRTVSLRRLNLLQNWRSKLFLFQIDLGDSEAVAIARVMPAGGSDLLFGPPTNQASRRHRTRIETL